MSVPRVLSPIDYQNLPQVVARVREFCGMMPGEIARCVYVTGMGAADGPHVTWGHVMFRPAQAVAAIMAAGDDLARSMWDTLSLLVYVDLDYTNADVAGEAYLHPADCFLKLEPVYRSIDAAFAEYSMPMLDLMTGAGYSFIGCVPRGGRAAARLALLAPETPPWHAAHGERRPAWANVAIDEREAKAYHGLGLVLEHFAHRVLAHAGPLTAIPLVVNNTEVGAGATGRECASIDLTHLGDPLDMRHLRAAFSLYQKHRLRPDLMGVQASRMPPLAVVPRRGRALMDMLEGRGLPRAADEARTGSAVIPNVEAGLLRMLDDYEVSDLAVWHREYYAIRPHPPEAWPDTYDRLDAAALPPCVAACLERPNDLVLKPSHIQLLVRTLLARGWNARHIACLVHSRYARVGVWGEHWQRVDPTTRAEFDVRVFAGLIAMGRDQGVDFNCVSTQAKGMCPGGARSIFEPSVTGVPPEFRHDLARRRVDRGVGGPRHQRGSRRDREGGVPCDQIRHTTRALRSVEHGPGPRARDPHERLGHRADLDSRALRRPARPVRSQSAPSSRRGRSHRGGGFGAARTGREDRRRAHHGCAA